MPNKNLSKAKRAKNDEFYTQYQDVEKEIMAYLDFDQDVFRGKTILLPCDDPEWSNFTKFFAQNFERFGLKKLISTSYAIESKQYKGGYQLSVFEETSPKYDVSKTKVKGKIFTLTHDKSGDGKIDINDLEWEYLEGDGDFRSDEVKKLRDESDIIITNPPFSLFRDFLAWIVEVDKKFVIIGSKNAITYKEVFPLIKENKMWVGTTSFNKDMLFISPEKIDPNNKPSTATRTVDGVVYLRSPSVWYTNIDHGRRHQPLPLMTMDDNIKFNKKMKGKNEYEEYENYSAIEVPFTNAIPSDYDKIMGVPISFLDKYSPEQFEILGMCENEDLYDLKTKVYSTDECKAAYLSKFGKKGTYDLNASGVVLRNGLLEKVYQRVLIKHKNPS
jgi:hypothetical protein